MNPRHVPGNPGIGRTDGITTVLFDLDGTLLDTAPDLAFALNTVLTEQRRDPLPYDRIRPVVSHGSIGLLRLGFGIEPGAPDFEPLRQRLLDVYAANLAVETRLFAGMEDLLAALSEQGLRWGVVTNKPGWLTEPLLQQLGLHGQAACIVSGDTTVQRKPDPEPLLHACHLAGCSALQCVYVGDAERDIEAGRRAGMRTLVARFGYIGEEECPEAWGADGLIDHPLQILDWLHPGALAGDEARRQ